MGPVSRSKRDDDTKHIRILGPHEKRLESPEEILADVVHMVCDALQARAVLVKELGAGVEWEAQLARERIAKDGIDADLSAIRIGEYFKRMTEFNLLQRVYRAIQSRMEGLPNPDRLSPDASEG